MWLWELWCRSQAGWECEGKAVLRQPLSWLGGGARGCTESCLCKLALSKDRSSKMGGSWCHLGIYGSQNDLTGEHSCIMLKMLADEDEANQGAWLAAFWKGESEWKWTAR